MKNRVQLIARKGDRTFTAWLLPEKVKEVGAGWVKDGYAVTITVYPGKAAN